MMMNNDDPVVESNKMLSHGAMERFAALMSTENITVEHRSVATGSFNMKTRVLTLPIWKDMTRATYAMLLQHEVGHALHTPLEGWHGACVAHKGTGFQSYLNVLEDARIEKKIHRKFPGGVPDFVQAWHDLEKFNFFGLEDHPIETLPLIDRINVHYKAHGNVDVPFTDEERVWIDRIDATSGFSDLLALAEELYEQEKTKSETDRHEDESGEGEPGEGEPGEEGEPGDEGEPGEEGEEGEEAAASSASGSEDGSSESEDGEDGEDGEEGEENSGNGPGEDGEDGEEASTGETAGKEAGAPNVDSNGIGPDGLPCSITDQAARASEKDMIDWNESETAYVQVAEDAAFNLERIVVGNNDIWKAIKSMNTPAKYKSNNYAKAAHGPINFEDDCNSMVSKHKMKNKGVINFLVKEFNLRKAADAHAKTTIATTGMLNCNKVHSYRWNEDIFRKSATVPTGQSHGMVLFIDWSSSMSDSVTGTLEQAMTLMMFCQKVNIPFDVYAFTDAYGGFYCDEMFIENKLKRGDIMFSDTLNLLHLASSSGGSKARKQGFNTMAALAAGWTKRRQQREADIPHVKLPKKLHMGCTPLNETIMAAIPVVNNFRKRHRLQVVNTVFLTDGQGSDCYNFKDTGNDSSIVIRDAKSRKQWTQSTWRTSDGEGRQPQMRILLEVLKLRTRSNVVNFFITDYPDSEVENSCDSPPGRKAISAMIAKDGGVAVKDNNLGWDDLYVIAGGVNLARAKTESGQLDVIGIEEGAVQKAFAHANANKLKNRVILKKFSEMISA